MTAPIAQSPRRLLFLTDPENGHVTVHIRGLMFADHFKNAGWHVEFINVREIPFDQIVQRAREFPAVYLLKVCFFRLIRELQAGAPDTKIIFDLTDALWQPIHRQCGWQNLEKILAASDAIFSENEFICAYGRQFSNHVISIPACTQVEAFDAARATTLPRDDGKLRLGWMGSNGTISALHAITPQLEHLFKHHPELHLRILGCSDPQLLPAFQHVRYSIVPTYDEPTMIQECLNFDIGLFPPPGDAEDYAVRGALKGMLYMTAGKPAVCLNTGDCARIMQDGHTAMLINTPEEWITKLETLISDPALRQRIGQNALAHIRHDHTIDAVFQSLTTALEEVLSTPRPAPIPSLT